MGEVIPGVAVFAVVLADRAPLPLAQVRPPFLPRDSRLARIVQAFLFSDIREPGGHFSLSPAPFRPAPLASPRRGKGYNKHSTRSRGNPAGPAEAAYPPLQQPAT